MSQDALGQLKHLKTARARWPFPDVATKLSIGQADCPLRDQQQTPIGQIIDYLGVS